ncbi:MAG: sugar ABC transporter permease [Chloroflexi bacterium]|nr:MAG: sugar ABC transporter permease [Chloroflexota bacterium]
MAEQSLRQISVARARRGLLHEIVRNRWAYLFISPFFVLFAIFQAFPIGYSVYISLFDWSGIGPMEHVGLKNYEYLTGPGGRAFQQSLQNGVILFFMYVPAMTLLAIVLAVLLNSKRVRGFRIYRTVLFMPYITSMIAAGITFQLLLQQDNGLFNVVLETLGFSSQPWLETKWLARLSLCLLIVWGWLGYNMVIMLAGLQTIPHELTEAARIDGANAVQAFFRITIPLLRPVIAFSVILSTIGSFGLFNETQALFRSTGGAGPLRSTLTPLVYIYSQAFGRFELGRAAAAGYLYFALIFILTLVQLRFVGREEE